MHGSPSSYAVFSTHCCFMHRCTMPHVVTHRQRIKRAMILLQEHLQFDIMSSVIANFSYNKPLLAEHSTLPLGGVRHGQMLSRFESCNSATRPCQSKYLCTEKALASSIQRCHAAGFSSLLVDLLRILRQKNVVHRSIVCILRLLLATYL